MQIEVKELDYCKLMVHYKSDPEEILNKRGDVLNAFKKAPVPGFRPGKASTDAIKIHYREQIEESLKRALAEDAYHNTIFEKKLKPHGAPRFNSVLMLDGKFSCEFELFTKPDFELAQYKGMEIPKPHQETSELELTEKLLQDLRVRHGEVEPYSENHFVQNGDNIIIDYEGALDGVKVDNLSSVGEMLTVGSSPFPEFDQSLYGMRVGETRTFNLVVPSSGLPSLIGKTITFTVTLTMGSRANLHPLDDSLARKVGKETLDELRELARGAATSNFANMERTSVNNAITNRLVNDNNFIVPHWLALSEAQYLAHTAKLDWNTMQDLDKERFISMANNNVKLSIILEKIRDNEPDAQMTDREIFDIIRNNLLKNQSAEKVDESIKEMNKTGYLKILFARVKDEATLDFVLKNTKFLE